jgi:hypothetical protein
MKCAHILWWIAAGISLVGCDPFEQRRAENEERKQIECLDKFCLGDVEPSHDMLEEEAFKLNGNWYIGPKKYGNPNFGPIAFYWPSGTPSGSDFSASKPGELKFNGAGAVDNFYDVAVEVILKGRHKYPISSVAAVEKPWERTSWEGRWKEMASSGMGMTRTELTPELDVVRFKQADGTPYRMSYFIAKGQKVVLGDYAPVAVCEVPSHPMNRCTGDFFVFDGTVHADFRFNAKHAQDWPAIYQEINRVLQQLRRI